MNHFDPDAEKAIIGAAFINENVVRELEIDEADFFDPRARLVWRRMKELVEQRLPLDSVLVGSPDFGSFSDELPGFLAECMIATPTADNAQHYASIVREHALSRAVMHAASEVLQASNKKQGVELLDVATTKFAAIKTTNKGDTQMTVKQLVKQTMGDMAKVLEGGVIGIPTGLRDLDAIIGGWQFGIASVVAARPGVGKSGFALGATDAASAAGYGVHVFSMEDISSAYGARMLARISNVPAEEMRTGTNMTREKMTRIRLAQETLYQRANWIIDSRAGLQVKELIRSVRREAADNGTRLVVVDYLQLMRKSDPRMQRHEAVDENITMMADAAKTDGMAYLVLSQLNRGLESRDDKRPRLSDLKESGAIEERSKCVIGLYREHMYDSNADAGAIELIVMKNNNGRTGCVEARWDGQTTRVYQ